MPKAHAPMKWMRTLAAVAYWLTIGIGLCGLGWFLVMVIFPFGLAVTVLVVALLATALGLMSLFREQR